MRSSTKIKAILGKMDLSISMVGGRVQVVAYDKETGESGIFENASFSLVVEDLFRYLKKHYKLKNSW